MENEVSRQESTLPFRNLGSFPYTSLVEEKPVLIHIVGAVVDSKKLATGIGDAVDSCRKYPHPTRSFCTATHRG